LAKLWFEHWLVGLWQCVQCGWGFFLLSLRGEEKNKINSIKFALSCQKAKSFLILNLSISYLSAVSVFTLVANGQRYIVGRRKGTKNFPAVKNLEEC